MLSRRAQRECAPLELWHNCWKSRSGVLRNTRCYCICDAHGAQSFSLAGRSMREKVAAVDAQQNLGGRRKSLGFYGAPKREWINMSESETLVVYVTLNVFGAAPGVILSRCVISVVRTNRGGQDEACEA